MEPRVMEPRYWKRYVSRVHFLVLILLMARNSSGSAQDVLTYHGDSLRTGWFSSETQLTVSKVNGQTFGLLHTVVLDGRVDAEPLYVSQLTIPLKGVHNVVFVVTENNSLYRIDADTGKIVGRRKFGSAVPYQYKNYDDNVFPVMGILGTPVIDRSAGVIYLVADTYNGKVDAFRLHAISITTLKDVVPPALIKFSARLADGTTWKFNPRYHLQRPGLLEANGSIYVAFGSNGDTQPDQSRGSIVRYDANTLAFLDSDVTDTLDLNTSPYYLSAIWQSGYGVAADSNGDIYFTEQGQTGLHDPTGRVYRLSRQGKLDCLIDTGISPNGLVLDPTETVLFVAMTRDNAIWRVPLMKDGGVAKVGRFCSTFGTSGPDGLTMDKAGRLFVAHASLGHVFVFAPNGELIARIKSCAGPSCTNVAIGGNNSDRLYVTESVTGTVLVADISVLDNR